MKVWLGCVAYLTYESAPGLILIRRGMFLKGLERVIEFTTGKLLSNIQKIMINIFHYLNHVSLGQTLIAGLGGEHE
jgi:hypothetical protein